MTHCILILVVSLVVNLLAATANADGFTYMHVVRAGETLASIAQNYYGDPRRESVLVAENGLDLNGGSSIVVGLHLTIPAVRYHRVREKETWATLAARFFGNKRRLFALVEANKGNSKVQPEQDAEVLVPYILRHVTAAKQDYDDIARLYYANSKYARDLRRFNLQRRGKPRRGQLILVPLNDLVLSPQARRTIEEETGRKLQSGDLRQEQEQITKRIPELREHLKKGRFVEAVVYGNRLLGSRALTVSQYVTVQRELATAYVALNREDLAKAAFRNALERQPELVVDSALTSPRVLSVLEKAKKKR